MNRILGAAATLVTLLMLALTSTARGTPVAASGYYIVPWATGVLHPTSLNWGPDGWLYVTRFEGQVLAIKDLDGMGLADTTVVFTSGLIWPLGLAPFAVEVIPLGADNPDVTKTADDIYQALNEKNIEALIDDRNESAGVKFKVADLIGIPFRIQIGKKGLEKGEVEIKNRKTGQVTLVKKEAVVEEVLKILS